MTSKYLNGTNFYFTSDQGGDVYMKNPAGKIDITNLQVSGDFYTIGGTATYLNMDVNNNLDVANETTTQTLTVTNNANINNTVNCGTLICDNIVVNNDCRLNDVSVNDNSYLNTSYSIVSCGGVNSSGQVITQGLQVVNESVLSNTDFTGGNLSNVGFINAYSTTSAIVNATNAYVTTQETGNMIMTGDISSLGNIDLGGELRNSFTGDINAGTNLNMLSHNIFGVNDITAGGTLQGNNTLDLTGIESITLKAGGTFGVASGSITLGNDLNVQNNNVTGITDLTMAGTLQNSGGIDVGGALVNTFTGSVLLGANTDYQNNDITNCNNLTASGTLQGNDTLTLSGIGSVTMKSAGVVNTNGGYIKFNPSTAPDFTIDSTDSGGFIDIPCPIITSGNNDPTATQLTGLLSNFRVYTFIGTGNGTQQAFAYIHIPHCYKPNSGVYFHIHSLTDSANPITGNFKINFEYSYANPDGTFVASQTISVVDTYANSYQHRITEIPNAVLANALEVDGIIALRIYRTPSDAQDTFAGDVHLLYIDCHIETTKWSTKYRNKATGSFYV